ncbi:MAG TPA: PAS domain S-box protein [bacterium]|nr:PAS domain S-box protein [bacterium]HPN29575.1 PAS domain S-box protein [bacterium]
MDNENPSILALKKYIHKLEIKYGELEEKNRDLIAEKKKLLKKLSKQLAEKNVILTAAMEGFAIINESGQIQFINDALSDILEYEGIEIINNYIYNFESEGSQEKFNERILQIENTKNIRYSTELKTKSGAYKSAEFSINQFCIQNKKLIFLLVRDTTENKVNQYLLERNRQSYKNLMDSLPDIVYKLDEKGQFTYINNSIKILGYEPEELIGKHFSVIIHQDDVKKVSRFYILPKYKGIITGDKDSPKLFDERRSGNRKTTNLQIRFIDKNQSYEIFKERSDLKREKIGSVISWGEVSSAGHYLMNLKTEKNNFIGTVGIIRLISDKLLEDDYLKDSEKLYRTVVENMPLLVSRYTIEGKFLFVNEAFCKYFGMTKEKILNFNAFDFIMIQDKKNVKKNLSVLTQDAPNITYNVRIVHINREQVKLHRRTDNAVFDAFGKILYIQSYHFEV